MWASMVIQHEVKHRLSSTVLPDFQFTDQNSEPRLELLVEYIFVESISTISLYE